MNYEKITFTIALFDATNITYMMKTCRLHMCELWEKSDGMNQINRLEIREFWLQQMKKMLMVRIQALLEVTAEPKFWNDCNLMALEVAMDMDAPTRKGKMITERISYGTR